MQLLKAADVVIEVHIATHAVTVLVAETDMQLAEQLSHEDDNPVELPPQLSVQPAPHPLHEVDIGFADAIDVQLAPQLTELTAPDPPLQLSVQPPVQVPVHPCRHVYLHAAAQFVLHPLHPVQPEQVPVQP